MWFSIPKVHLKTPEASKLIELDAEFELSCIEEAEAVNNNLWETDPDRFEVIENKARRLHQELTIAVEAYDKATGEPKPVPLTKKNVQTVRLLFSDQELEKVHAILCKTLAYIARQGSRELEKIAECITLRANGDLKLLTILAEEAKRDYRDILFE